MRSVLFNQFLASAEANDRQGVVNVSSQLLVALRQLGTVTGELRALSGITTSISKPDNVVGIGLADWRSAGGRLRANASVPAAIR